MAAINEAGAKSHGNSFAKTKIGRISKTYSLFS
jgi:hypothetical protein